MAYLNFISDSDLENHIKETLDEYRETLKGINLERFNENIIDPIKLTFDSIIYNKKIKTILNEEIARQRDKSNTNAIGYFHQKIFKYVRNCEVPQKGFDIIFNDGTQKYYIELKNKHNTMNKGSADSVYINLQNQALKESDCICALVEVIAKNSQNIKWQRTMNGQKVENERIRRISIDKFYEIVTGEKDAFAKLCKVLPEIITKIVNKTIANKREKDTVFQELKQKDKNLLKSLYLLAFKTYEGFDNF